MSELTAKENIKTADTVKRITATAVMAALTTLMTAYIFHIPVGVNGAIGSTYNFMLKKFKRIWNAYHEGRQEEAEKIQHEACRIIDALLQVRDITAVKYLLGRKGIVCGDCRSPFSPITEAQKQLLDGIGDLD